MLRLRPALGVDASVIFHDRFVSKVELAEFLGAADIYVTPYLNPEQITSGTLAYAVGAGKAVMSTRTLRRGAARRGPRGAGAVARPGRDRRARGQRAARTTRAECRRWSARAAASVSGCAGPWRGPTSTASSRRPRNYALRRSRTRVSGGTLPPLPAAGTNLSHLAR
jgi:hypothetical protein